MKSLSLRNTILLLSFSVAFLAVTALYILTEYNCIAVDIYTISIIGIVVFFSVALVSYPVLKVYVFSPVDKIRDYVIKYRKENNVQKDVLYEPVVTGESIIDLYSEIEAWMGDRKYDIDRLRKLEIYRKEFLGNVSHELKTPVFNIQGYIVTLLEGAIDDKAVNREYLQRAEKSVDRMINMINDLEAITQLETGQLEIEYEKFDIVALIKDVFETEEMKATSKGIILRFKEGNEASPVFVYADKFRIRQVITNLVTNSIKYGKEYGETVARIYHNDNHVVVEIADNGPGISQSHLPRIFERFYRVDKGRSRAQGGTGLGLSIVKHIIEAHGQTISVTSKEGAGTAFSFTLKSAKDINT